MPDQWTVRSFYIGKKKNLQGLSFPTFFVFDTEEEAKAYSGGLNAIKVDRWPGHEFEFRVALLEEVADTTEE